MSHLDFELAGGSTIGRDHRLVPRNGQDDWYVARDRLSTVAVVADGCGSGRHSEVGAKLGTRLLADCIQNELRRPDMKEGEWIRVRHDLLSRLDMVAQRMGPDYRQVVEEYFLFTLVGVVLADDTATFFAFGDGVIVINGETIRLGPFPGNAPPYIGYDLLADCLGGPRTDRHEFAVIRQMPLSELEHFAIGSDGVLDLIDAADRRLPGTAEPIGGVAQFWQQDRYFSNPELVNRRLKLAARDWPKRDPEPGLLPDDTTLIVGRRIPPNPET